jgi:hypothetical protein
LVAGLTTWLVLAGMAIPPELGAGSMAEEMTRGPLVHGLDRWLRSLSALGLATIVAIAAFAGTLAFFDHRNTRDQLAAAPASIAALAGAFGVALLAEASVRAGLLAAWASPRELAGLLALVLAWSMPVRAALRRRRAAARGRG